MVTRPWPWPWPWPWPSAEGLKTYSRALLDMIIWDKNHGRLPRLRRGPPSVPYPSCPTWGFQEPPGGRFFQGPLGPLVFWAKMIVYDRIEDKINSQVIWPYFTHWPPHSQNRPKKWKKNEEPSGDSRVHVHDQGPTLMFLTCPSGELSGKIEADFISEGLGWVTAPQSEALFGKNWQKNCRISETKRFDP